MSHFFSPPQPTIEQAAQLHEYALFSPAAIFQVESGAYVYGLIREMESPPQKTAESMRPLSYTLVAYHGPLINVWRSYPGDEAMTIPANGGEDRVKMDERQAARLLKRLKDLDTLDAQLARFGEHAKKVNTASAIELHGGPIITAHALSRIVRPLIGDREEGLDTEPWIERVKAARDDAARHLLQGHWRSNSTSIMQNAINQWEAEAMAAFVEMLRFAGLD